MSGLRSTSQTGESEGGESLDDGGLECVGPYRTQDHLNHPNYMEALSLPGQLENLPIHTATDDDRRRERLEVSR